MGLCQDEVAIGVVSHGKLSPAEFPLDWPIDKHEDEVPDGKSHSQKQTQTTRITGLPA
jgi:hypothetical protein